MVMAGCKDEGFDVKTLWLWLAVKMKEGAMSQGKPVASRTWKRQENKLSRNSHSLDF